MRKAVKMLKIHFDEDRSVRTGARAGVSETWQTAPNLPSLRSSAVSGGSCLSTCRASRLRNGLALPPEAGSAFHERTTLRQLLQRRLQGRLNLLEAMTRPCICA